MAEAGEHSTRQEPREAAPTTAMVIAAVGVVFGDIGTSPLYTLKEVFVGGYGVKAGDTAALLGILSLILWSLILTVSIKYVVFVLRANNQGEGGVMALTALAGHAARHRPRFSATLIVLGLLGASLFYGDSMITPAISVLSAMEGVEIVFTGLEYWIIPLSLIVLIGLFLIQRHGTARVGILFGPIMVLWFITLAALGLYGIFRYPAVLQAINPYWVIHFFIIHPEVGVFILGATVLALTGAEALYADMGHFGRRPITRAWFALVFPALVLNYFGQGAMILHNPEAAHNPFYLLAPSWALIPLLILATLATVIASQAVISGAFSLTRQAMQLGFIPRMFVQHTSSREKGQIYIAGVNWALMVGVVLLVLDFESSSALASAYGVAVTGTMLVTTLLLGAVIWLHWRWPLWLAIPFFCLLLLIDGLFFAANLPKVFQGGAFPVIVGIALFILLTTWKRGRQLLVERLDEGSADELIASICLQAPHRVQGTAVFLTARTNAMPHALLHNLLHNQVLHEQVVLLTVVSEDSPRVAESQRSELESYGNGFYRIVLHFGFMEDPDIPAALAHCQRDGLDFSPMRTTYFLSRETVVPSRRLGMARWREMLFSFMLKSANSNLRYFNLPLNRVIELGTQIAI